MSSLSTKMQIIEQGAVIVRSKGFRATGIQEVLDASGVPRGSFYFYFRNKAAFGLALVEYFEDSLLERMEEFLGNGQYPPVVRLARFFGFYHAMLEDKGFRQGCPLGMLAQEMAGIDQEFGRRIEGVFQKAQNRIAECLMEAAASGGLSQQMDIDETAGFIVNSWEGAMLRMKAAGDSEPLRLFERVLFDRLLLS